MRGCPRILTKPLREKQPRLSTGDLGTQEPGIQEQCGQLRTAVRDRGDRARSRLELRALRVETFGHLDNIRERMQRPLLASGYLLNSDPQPRPPQMPARASMCGLCPQFGSVRISALRKMRSDRRVIVRLDVVGFLSRDEPRRALESDLRPQRIFLQLRQRRA